MEAFAFVEGRVVQGLKDVGCSNHMVVTSVSLSRVARGREKNRAESGETAAPSTSIRLDRDASPGGGADSQDVAAEFFGFGWADAGNGEQVIHAGGLFRGEQAESLVAEDTECGLADFLGLA